MLRYVVILSGQSLFDCLDKILDLSLQFPFPWNFLAPTNLTFSACSSPMYHVLSLLLWICSKIITGMVSKAE
ncbi:mCG7682 [Mus musculus]|nr:mCG7682 [Mus musculus]